MNEKCFIKYQTGDAVWWLQLDHEGDFGWVHKVDATEFTAAEGQALELMIKSRNATGGVITLEEITLDEFVIQNCTRNQFFNKLGVTVWCNHPEMATRFDNYDEASKAKTHLVSLFSHYEFKVHNLKEFNQAE